MLAAFRPPFVPLSWPCLCGRAAAFSSGRAPPPAPTLTTLSTSEDMRLAKAWIDEFAALSPASIPRDQVDLSFSRASGPGGQNVNKLSTRASLRLCLSPFPAWLPAYVLPALCVTQHYVPSSHSLLLSSGIHRSQAMNVNECFKRLKALLLNAAAKDVKGEMSEERAERRRMLIAVEKRRVGKEKRKRKGVKEGRREKGSWD